MGMIDKNELIEMLIKERGDCVEAKYKHKGTKRLIAECCQEVLEHIIEEVGKLEVHHV